VEEGVSVKVKRHIYRSDEIDVFVAQIKFASRWPLAVDYSRSRAVEREDGYELAFFVRGWHPAYWVIAVWNLWRRLWS
jgi:hypothetical protein